jgi:hypothetical protein
MSDRMRISLMRRWTRIGVLFNAAPAAERVDLEALVLDTAAHARSDERLFVMAASWLAAHHHLLDARRLGRRLTGTHVDVETSAVAGAILSFARTGVTGPTALDAAIRHCRPLPKLAPLFPQLEAHPGLLALVKKEALPLFKAWGFWHNDATLKLNAIRPATWIVQHCPELRIRALLGAGLDAEIVELLLEAPRTAADLAGATETTYAAVHAAVTRLLGRGVLVHVRGETRGRARPLAANAELLTAIAA